MLEFSVSHAVTEAYSISWLCLFVGGKFGSIGTFRAGREQKSKMSSQKTVAVVVSVSVFVVGSWLISAFGG